MSHANSDNIHRLASALTVPSWTEGPLPETGGPIDVAARIMRSVITLYSTVDAVIEEAGSNPDLSKSGKEKARRTAGEGLLAEHEKLKEETERVIGGEVGKARARQPQLSAEERVAASLRATEIRNALSGLADDSLKLEIVVREAVDRGDTETLDALLTAPAALPLASAFDREAVTAARREMVDAALGEDVVQLVVAEGDLMDRLEWTADHIREAAGIKDNDGIVSLAHASVSA